MDTSYFGRRQRPRTYVTITNSFNPLLSLTVPSPSLTRSSFPRLVFRVHVSCALVFFFCCCFFFVCDVLLSLICNLFYIFLCLHCVYLHIVYISCVYVRFGHELSNIPNAFLLFICFVFCFLFFGFFLVFFCLFSLLFCFLFLLFFFLCLNLFFF